MTLISAHLPSGSLERNEHVLLKVGFYFYFFAVRNWMCGMCACVNRQQRVSHGETVRVGSSELLIPF